MHCREMPVALPVALPHAVKASDSPAGSDEAYESASSEPLSVSSVYSAMSRQLSSSSAVSGTYIQHPTARVLSECNEDADCMPHESTVVQSILSSHPGQALDQTLEQTEASPRLEPVLPSPCPTNLGPQHDIASPAAADATSVQPIMLPVPPGDMPPTLRPAAPTTTVLLAEEAFLSSAVKMKRQRTPTASHPSSSSVGLPALPQPSVSRVSLAAQPPAKKRVISASATSLEPRTPSPKTHTVADLSSAAQLPRWSGLSSDSDAAPISPANAVKSLMSEAEVPMSERSKAQQRDLLQQQRQLQHLQRRQLLQDRQTHQRRQAQHVAPKQPTERLLYVRHTPAQQSPLPRPLPRLPPQVPNIYGCIINYTPNPNSYICTPPLYFYVLYKSYSV